MKNKIAFILFMLCIAISLPLAFAQDEPITLRLAVADDQGRDSETYVLEFIEQVKTLSDGGVIIEPIWGAGYDTAAYYEAGVIQLVTASEYELGLVASRAWDNEGVTSLQALQAPFLITSDALAEAVAGSDVAARMLNGMSPAGVVGLTLWPEDLRHPLAFEPFGKTFLSPEDFAGTTIRAIPSGVTWAMIKALGATPIFKDGYGPDVIVGQIQGAESGLRQGAFLPVPATATGNVVFFPKFQVLFVNGEAFKGLSKEQQTVLRDAAMATQEKAVADHPREGDAASEWCAEGGTIVLASAEQVSAFERAAQPVFEQIERDPLNAELITAIRDLKASTEPSPGAEACGPNPTDVMFRGTTPPNGAYRIAVTEEELLARGARPSFARENDGSTTWTFKDGQMDMRFESGSQADDCTWTYRTTGDVLRLELPVGDCSNVEVVLEMLWRGHEDGGLKFLVLTTTDPTVQELVDTRALFERTWQKIEQSPEATTETEVWSEGLPLNGVWQVELTQDDLLGQGLLQAKAAEWTGTYTWTFQDGKATTRAEGIAPYTCEATYAVVGDVVRFTYNAGSDCEDEIDDMKWRLDDDGLHLHLVDITNAPFFENKAYLEAKPWQRVD